MELGTPEEVREKYGPHTKHIEDRAIMMMLGAYYEGVGVLVQRGLIDITLIDDLLWAGIRDYWERASSYIQEQRKLMDTQRMYDHIEILYNHMQKLEQQRTKDNT
jgi:hypothetical protein